MIKPKSLQGSSKEELFKRLLESIDQKFGTSSPKEGIHLFFAPNGYTEEEITKAKKEYLENGGDPDILFFVIKFVSAKGPPREVKAGHEGNIVGDGDTPKNPKQIAQRRLDKNGLTGCLD